MLDPPKVNAKIQQAYMLYEFDLLGRESYYRVDLTIERDGEAIGTPVTPSYEARLQTKKPLEVAKREIIELRLFFCCFLSLNDPQKETKLRVYNPYRPATPEWKQLARELIDYPNVLAVNYQGENHTKNYEDFIA